MSRPIRAKIFVCRFQTKDEFGYHQVREITPIVALDADHALSLVWKQHGQYLANFFGPPLEWESLPTITAKYDKPSNRMKKFLLGVLDFVEIKAGPLWCATNGYYVAPEIRTPIG